MRSRIFAALFLGVAGCAQTGVTTPSPYYATEAGGNAVSVWGGAFRINGGPDWTLERITASDRDFRAAYRSATILCRFTVTTASVGDHTTPEQLNTQTRARTNADYQRDARTARHISPLSERMTGTALVLVWDHQDAHARYHVRNQAALRPAGGRTVLAAKDCESAAPLDASSAAVQGIRAVFNFQSPFWAPSH